MIQLHNYSSQPGLLMDARTRYRRIQFNWIATADPIAEHFLIGGLNGFQEWNGLEDGGHILNLFSLHVILVLLYISVFLNTLHFSLAESLKTSV
jgi:hypothetical protein